MGFLILLKIWGCQCMFFDFSYILIRIKHHFIDSEEDFIKVKILVRALRVMGRSV